MFRAVAVDPSNPDIVFAGANIGGIFKSTDGARSWRVASRGLPANTRVKAFAVDPDRPGTVYAATDGGVYKSRDGGAIWLSSSEGLIQQYITALALDPSDARTLYAGASGNGGDVLFKSTDGAATWANVTGAIASLWVGALAIDPSDPRVVYAGTLRAGVLYKSINAGRSWRRTNRGLSSDDLVSTVVIDPHDSGTVYAGTPGSGLFRSTNGGLDWLPASNGWDSSFVGDIVIHPFTSSVIYAASHGLYKSTDRGEHWRKTIEGLPPVIGELEIDGRETSTLYATYGGAIAGEGLGVYKTTDAGESWTRHTLGLSGASATAVAVDPTDPDTVYAGTSTGVYRSTTGGRRWHASPGDLEMSYLTALVVDPSDPAVLYASALDFPGGPFKSTDGGHTWFTVDEGIDGGLMLNLAIDPADPSRLLAAGGGVYLSTDGARTWARVRFPDPFYVNTLRFHPTEPATFYVGTGNNSFGGGELYVTTNGGRNWRVLLRLDEPWWTVADVEVDPGSPDRLYVASRIYGGRGAVHRSTDGGRTWTTVGGGTIEAEVPDLALHPTDPSIVYAATYDGVFVSADRGERWEPMSQGLLATFAESIALDSSGSVAYVAVTGGGVYRLDLS